MNRIEKRFAELKASGGKGLVGYLTAGDPDEAASEAGIRVALEGGLDVLELGVPFSDPTADGPTIQAAAFRALQNGMTVEKVLGMVRRLRMDFETPIVLFGYLNPVLRYGCDRFCADAAAAGADGLLVVDLPHEEAAEVRSMARKHGLLLVPLVAPTTPPERARTILAEAEGFVYYIMVKGVTGARENVAGDVGEHIKVLRQCTDLPIAAGFGVSNGEQVRRVAASADAVVVGSALVRAAQEGNLAALVRDLREHC